MIKRVYGKREEEMIRQAEAADLTEIYQLLFDHFEKVPGIYFVENLPRPYTWAKDAQTNYDVIELCWTSVDRMKEALQTAIDQKKANQNIVYEVFEESDYVFTSRISEVYKTALSICSLLHITCPMIYVVTKEKLGNCSGVQGFKEMENGVFIPWVGISVDGLKYQVINLAHELRHWWQKEHHHFDVGYISPEDDVIGYLFQDKEIDADAFACMYFEKKYASDPIKFYSYYKDAFLLHTYSNAVILQIQSIKDAA